MFVDQKKFLLVSQLNKQSGEKKDKHLAKMALYQFKASGVF